VSRHEPLMGVFAHLIGEEMASQDLSQAEFARRTGASTKHVNQFLGTRTGVSLPMLDYWAHVLGCRWEVRLRPVDEVPE